jgi:hypothetical protein
MSSHLQPPNPFDTPAPSFTAFNPESGMNTPQNEDTLLTPEVRSGAPYTEKTAVEPRRPRRMKWAFVGVGAFVVVIVVVYFTVIKPKNLSTQTNSSSTSDNGNNPSPTNAPPPPDVQTDGKTTGGDGTIVYTTNGNFTYKNPFGGFWVYDPKNPFRNGAKAQVRAPPRALYCPEPADQGAW